MKKSILGFVIGILSIGLLSSQCYATRVRRKFEPEEDMKLKQLVQQYGQDSWKEIAFLMGNNRNARQCRERWKDYFSVDYNKSPFSEVEDKLIIEQAEKLGHKWFQIAKMLVNRSNVQVKNRWAQLRKSMDRTTNPFSVGGILYLYIRAIY